MAVLRFSGFDPEELKKRYDEPPPMRDLRVVSAWFERAAERGLLRPTDYQVAAMTVLSAMHGPAMLTGLLGEHPTGHTRDEYVAAVVDLIVDGLAHSADALKRGAAVATTVPVSNGIEFRSLSTQQIDTTEQTS